MKALHIFPSTSGDNTQLVKDLEAIGYPTFYHYQPKGGTLHTTAVTCYDYDTNERRNYLGHYEIRRFIYQQRKQTYVSPFDGKRK
jgi:hypothetical protein